MQPKTKFKKSFVSRTDFVLSSIREFVGYPKHILDIGFIGEYNSPFIHLSTIEAFPKATITGIDINPKIKGFKSTNQRKYFQISVYDLHKHRDFQNVFDVVIACEVLEHLLNPFWALLNINFSLKPSGRTIITVPNPLSYRPLVKYLTSREIHDAKTVKNYLGSPDHVCLLMPPSLFALLERAGMVVESVRFLKSKLSRFPILDKFSPYIGIVARKEREISQEKLEHYATTL